MKKSTVDLINKTIFFLFNIFLIVLFDSCVIESSKVSDVKLIPVLSGGLFQYIDTEGNVIINPQFSEATVFRNGLALVKIQGEEPLWGYIKEDGKFAITPNYKKATVFSEDLAWVVSTNGNATAINNKGEEIILLKDVIRVKTFKEGFAAYSEIDYENWSTSGASPFKWGFIDKSGNIKINPQFSDVENFSNGMCAVKNSDGKWGYINKEGKMLIKHQFDGAKDFSNDKAIVLVNYMVGAIDKNGEYIIKPHFSELLPDGENYLIEQDGKWGWCDKDGRIIINPQFDKAFRFFGNNLTPVKLGDNFGYINKDGMIEINPQFQFALPFNSRVALVIVDDKVGFIDEKGKIKAMKEFDQISKDFIQYLLNTSVDYESIESNLSNDILDPKEMIRNPKTGNMDGYCYISNKGIESVKSELRKYGVEFIDDYMGYASCEFGSCYSVQLKEEGNLVALYYGFECD